MSGVNVETEGERSSNRERLDMLEGHTSKIMDILGEVNTNMTELRMALNATSRDSIESRRSLDSIRRENHESIERLERRLVEDQGQRHETNGQKHDAFVDGVETSVTKSMHVPPRDELRRGGRVENNHVAVERWIHDEGNRTRSPTMRGEPHGVRYEIPRHENGHEAKYEHDRERPLGHDNRYERRHYDRERDGGHHGRRDGDGHHYDERVGNRTYDRRPKRPKVDFPKFNGGDPYEWLDKVDHYFRVYDVPRRERVSTACFYLEGRASKW
ncbi:uncharacterized protein LOC122318678 [Carya illinoinensis]|uniref:uncharacterized protein LOC122318678 n=1 Tax=Carya illinoinensis TaxID=32201 RepID=UPI001C719323|nr:uncharacterized protein LOC122318678 [Carya illinoinensis]